MGAVPLVKRQCAPPLASLTPCLCAASWCTGEIAMLIEPARIGAIRAYGLAANSCHTLPPSKPRVSFCQPTRPPASPMPILKTRESENPKFPRRWPPTISPAPVSLR